MRTLLRFALPVALCATMVGDSHAAPAVGLRFTADGHTRIPFDLRNQHVWIRGQLNGRDSIWIVVDSGASATMMDDGVAKRLGLKRSGSHRTHGPAGMLTGTMAENVTVSLPGITLERKRLGAVDLSAFARGGRPMEMILGYELFESSVVRFDYANNLMEVWDSKHAPPRTGGATVPMTLENNHPYVEASLKLPGRAPLEGRFLIDTGSSMALSLAPEVAARESVARALPRTLKTIARGVGGELKSEVGRAESFSLGSLEFSKPTVSIPEPAAQISMPGSVGNIGGQILRRCRVTFDYAKKEIHFEPAQDFEKPFDADMLGATLIRGDEKSGFSVRWVNPETPAAEAGLQVGDVVTHVDGEPAQSIDPSFLRKQMQQEGREVKLRFQRGAESREVSARLRRLL
jgi:hypothetical protein